jgi:hypothetical protein
VLLVFLWVVAGAAVSGTVPGAEVHAGVGFAGWFAPGKIAPLQIDLRSPMPLAADLQVEVPSELRGGTPVTHVVPFRLPAGGRYQATVDVVVRDPRRPILLTVRDAHGERLRHEVPLGVARVVDGVVAALTDEAAGLEFLSGVDEKRRPAYLAEDALPVRWQAYEAVDLLIIRDLDPRAMAPAQEQALVEWIAQGGRLLVVAPHRLHLEEARRLADLIPSAGERAYGRGVVAAAPEDLFAPELRSRGALREHVAALLRRPAAPPVAPPVFADLLPATRPLPGATQVGLAGLSVLYILVLRAILPRVPARRLGWLGLVIVAAAATAAMYGVAAGARSAATSLAQLSVAEMLGTLPSARVITYASVIAPYGGRFAVRVPSGIEARPSGGGGVTYDAGRGEISGAAADGQLLLVARQIVPLRLQVRWSPSGALTMDPLGAGVQHAVLYRRRQVYKLPPEPAATITLDPARWEPVDRPGTLGSDVAGRAMDALFRRLDRAGDTTWLVGQIGDERLGLHTARGAAGDNVRLVVAEVR